MRKLFLCYKEIRKCLVIYEKQFFPVFLYVYKLFCKKSESKKYCFCKLSNYNTRLNVYASVYALTTYIMNLPKCIQTVEHKRCISTDNKGSNGEHGLIYLYNTNSVNNRKHKKVNSEEYFMKGINY
jgi:hypothetical protein